MLPSLVDRTERRPGKNFRMADRVSRKGPRNALCHPIMEEDVEGFNA